MQERGGSRVPLGVSDQVTETVAAGAKATRRAGQMDGQKNLRRRQPKRHLDLQRGLGGNTGPPHCLLTPSGLVHRAPRETVRRGEKLKQTGR